MSKKAASDFMDLLATDPVLQQELDAALAGASTPSELFSRMAAFAASRGHDVTAEELSDAGLPLSDEQLSQVSGGAETVHLYLKAYR